MGDQPIEIEKTIVGLERRNMRGYYAADEKDLIRLIGSLLVKGAVVGCGDSVTLEETGVFDFLRNGDYVFLDKYEKGLSAAQKREIYLKNFSADAFITGTNAVTENGELFNIDGNGSRVAPLLYGPRRVLIVVGQNKIVPNIALAVQRARMTAAPRDARRLHKNTPCTKTDTCIDCNHPERICNDFVAIKGQFIKDRIQVIIVGKQLGY